MNGTNSSPSLKAINLSEFLHALIADACGRISSFSHIDAEKIHICISSNRSGRGATFGKVVPLKFKGGEEVLYHRGKCYVMPKIEVNSTRILYLIYFYIPRFTDLAPIEKLRVIFHELYHIHPEFNGDIRRFGRSGSAHGNSKKKFDTQFEREVVAYSHAIRNTPVWEFLTLDTRKIFENYREVLSYRMKVPKPIILETGMLR